MKYYFAYGSNMDEAQMRQRCPNGKLLGSAELRGYKLAFTIYSPKRDCGCTDIIQNERDSVWGLLYELSEEEILDLDKFEGAPIYYHRISVKVYDSENKSKQVEIYEVVNKENEFQSPSRDYLGKILAAAKDFDFPENYQNFLNKIPVIEK